MRAWTFQDHRQKKKLGEKKCPWSVGWIDPEGKRRSKRIGSKSMAEKSARKLEGQLAAGTYQGESRKDWADFLEEYKQKMTAAMPWRTREVTLIALGHFQRIAQPGRLQGIKRQTIDRYVAQRHTEGGWKGKAVSPATINKELRVVRAVLRMAHDWGYLPDVPKVPMLREPGKLPRYVTPEDFARIYKACDTARRPQSGDHTPGDWWQALSVFGYMTGWRISEILAVRWDDVSLDKATALTRAEDNKGRRDELVPLHPVVVEHLRRLVDVSIHSPVVFSWPHHRRTLWEDFHGIQQAAGIAPEAFYGFHDLRRAFATLNAPRLSADALQALMRHKCYQTTQRYINMSRQLDAAVERLEVPEVLRKRD